MNIDNIIPEGDNVLKIFRICGIRLVPNAIGMLFGIYLTVGVFLTLIGSEFLIISLPVLAITLYMFFQQWGTIVCITDRNVIIRKGLLATSIETISFDKLESVSLQNGFIEGLFGLKEIKIIGIGGSIHSVYGLESSGMCKEIIQNLLNKRVSISK